MATRSSILAWKIPCTEEPGGLQSLGSQRVRHDWAAEPAQVSSATWGWGQGLWQSLTTVNSTNAPVLSRVEEVSVSHRRLPRSPPRSRGPGALLYVFSSRFCIWPHAPRSCARSHFPSPNLAAGASVSSPPPRAEHPPLPGASFILQSPLSCGETPPHTCPGSILFTAYNALLLEALGDSQNLLLLLLVVGWCFKQHFHFKSLL